MSSFYRIKLKKFRTRISVFYLTINWPLSILSKNNYELVYVLIHFLNMRYIRSTNYLKNVICLVYSRCWPLTWQLNLIVGFSRDFFREIIFCKIHTNYKLFSKVTTVCKTLKFFINFLQIFIRAYSLQRSNNISERFHYNSNFLKRPTVIWHK